MPEVYTRGAIQFEADFAAHYFGLTPKEALTHEAVHFFNYNQVKGSHDFDSDETDAWLRQYLPANITDRQRILREAKTFQKRIHFDDASYQHYCHEYTQFSKNYPNNHDVNAD